MAIDYALQFPCEVRKHIPEQRLALLAGYMNLARDAAAEIGASAPAASGDAISGHTVHLLQKGPDGSKKQVSMTLGQLTELARPLVPYQEHCALCRANIAGRAFGCIDRIDYPIRRETEQWLLSRLPDDGDNPDLRLFFRLLARLKIDGRVIDAARPKLQLFELPAPLVRRWGAGQVTSSQVLHALAFSGNLRPQQAALYTRALRLASVLSEPHASSDNIEQFKALIRAIVMSECLKAELAIEA